MDKRKVAEIILRELDQNAPVQINWNFEEQWLRAIETGLRKAEETETPAAGTAGESR